MDRQTLTYKTLFVCTAIVIKKFLNMRVGDWVFSYAKYLHLSGKNDA